MRKKKLDNQKKIIIIGSLCLLLCLCVGYAAFQTTISLKAKGNVKEKPAAEKLKELVVADGDGLYEDAYEEGRYFYKGSNPNNYITFNNEVWRIISVDADGSIKIIRNRSIGSMPFDSSGLRDNLSNGTGGTYCANGYDGCSVWAVTDNFVNKVNGSGYEGTVLKDAEINTYLNSTYYNIVGNKDKIINHEFGYGIVNSFNDLSSQIIGENSYKWNGKIGLIAINEYLRANTNIDQCGNLNLNNTNKEICKTTNWIYNIVLSSGEIWTMTPTDLDIRVCNISDSGYACENNAPDYPVFEKAVVPVLYLSADIKLSGEGTELSPYVIE